MNANLGIHFEAAFVERLQQGDRVAFAELYDRYGKALFNVIYEVVKSVADAENLLQDTFVKIWRNIHLYDAQKARLYTWLVIIARRRALDFVRSRQFSGGQIIQSTEILVSLEADATATQQLDHIGMDAVVGKLGRPLQQVIHLQYFMGYTQQEVADALKIPLGTVKSRTRTALLELRRLL